MKNKIMRMFFFINRITKKINKRTIVIVVKSSILSLINYCVSIWGSTNKTLFSKVKKTRKLAAKVATGGARKYDHVTIMKE